LKEIKRQDPQKFLSSNYVGEKERMVFIMKKVVILILVLALAFSVVGCNPATIKKGDAVPVLTWYVPGDKQPDMALVMEKVNAIIEPKIGAKLDLQMMDAGGFQEKMTMMMASGTEFDMTFTGAGNNYDSLVSKGGLLDITDMIDKEAPKLREVVREYAFKNVTRKGKIYGVPNMQIHAGVRSLIIQKKLADEYKLNIETIKKVDDIEPFLEWVHKTHPNLFPYQSGQGVGTWDVAEYVELDNVMGIKNTDLFDNNDTADVVWLRDTQIDNHAIAQLRNWYLKGYIRPDVLSVTDDRLDSKSGRYAVQSGMWKPGMETDYFNNTGFEVVVAKLDVPSFVSGAENAMISISRTSKNPVKSLKLIEMINTNKELYNLIAFGVEGKHYTKNAEGKCQLNKQSGYYHNASWRFGNVFNSIIQVGQSSDVWEKTMALNDSAKISPLLGFVLDKTNITSEISAVTSIYSQYKVLQCGAEEREVFWKEYTNKLEVAGLKKIKDETQRQVNEFLKQK
jgi:putative aldouronate transport system substrate-binding protein